MPKAGFKSVTFSETIYEKLHVDYEKKKSQLQMKGINSFSGYVTSILIKEMEIVN